MHACVCASVPPRDPSASAAGILGFASLPPSLPRFPGERTASAVRRRRWPSRGSGSDLRLLFLRRSAFRPGPGDPVPWHLLQRRLVGQMGLLAAMCGAGLSLGVGFCSANLRRVSCLFAAGRVAPLLVSLCVVTRLGRLTPAPPLALQHFGGPLQTRESLLETQAVARRRKQDAIEKCGNFAVDLGRNS